MYLQAFPSGPFETNAYLIACPHTGLAAVVDPAPDSFDAVVAAIEEHKFTPIAILLTHSHWDHIADVIKFKTKYQIPVFVHPLDAPNLEEPGADLLPCWIDIPGVRADKNLKDGDLISVGEIVFEVIDTPGHSPGSVCFYCKSEEILISGDTLFRGSIGNISFPTSRPKLMWTSLDKLAKLPASTRVYPGHGSSTTIGNEIWLSQAESVFG